MYRRFLVWQREAVLGFFFLYMKVNQELNCNSFLNYFIEQYTIPIEDLRVSLGNLLDIVENTKNENNPRYKDYFDIILIGKNFIFTGNKKDPGLYCGDSYRQNERRLMNLVYQSYSFAIRYFDTERNARDQHKTFIDGLVNFPNVHDKSLKNKILSYQNVLLSESLLKDFANKIIIPVLFKKCIGSTHTNSLNYFGEDYILNLIQELKWKDRRDDIMKMLCIDEDGDKYKNLV